MPAPSRNSSTEMNTVLIFDGHGTVLLMLKGKRSLNLTIVRLKGLAINADHLSDWMKQCGMCMQMAIRAARSVSVCKFSQDWRGQGDNHHSVTFVTLVLAVGFRCYSL